MKHNEGFTLIEIIVVIAILTIIASFGLLASFGFFRSLSFRSEESTIVSLLQNARSQSMNNIDQVQHGVHFMSGQYVIFECNISIHHDCTTYADADNTKDLVIKTSYSSSISSPALPFDVIFDQLSGDSTAITIVTNDQGNTKNITVNSVGQIDWQ